KSSASNTPSGGLVVEKVVETGLRLCNAGILMTTAKEKKAFTYAGHENQRRFGNKKIDHDETKVQAKLNQFGGADDSDNDVDHMEQRDHHGRRVSGRCTTGEDVDLEESSLALLGVRSPEEEELFQRQKQLGLSLIKPHVDLICDGLLQLLSQRKEYGSSVLLVSSGNNKNFHTAGSTTPNNYRSHGYFDSTKIVTPAELQLIFQLTDLFQLENVETAKKLCLLLVQALFDCGLAKDHKNTVEILDALEKLV
ncbi:unnamed protein product, partial [Amoebophrya sp. A120]